jgi:hypothetical protein
MLQLWQPFWEVLCLWWYWSCVDDYCSTMAAILRGIMPLMVLVMRWWLLFNYGSHFERYYAFNGTGHALMTIAHFRSLSKQSKQSKYLLPFKWRTGGVSMHSLALPCIDRPLVTDSKGSETLNTYSLSEAFHICPNGCHNLNMLLQQVIIAMNFTYE